MKILWAFVFLFSIFMPFMSKATIVESNGTGGGNWINGSSWNGGSTPVNGDTVVILAGDVITISSNLSFDGVIQVYGTLSLDGGKLSMDASSAIQLAEGSSIEAIGAGENNSISIGGSSNKLTTDDINSLSIPNQLTEESVAAGGGCAETGLCDDNPLPVEVIYFSARTKDQGVQLNWATSSEEDFDYFTIERSSDGENFNKLVNLYSKSEFSNKKKEYQFFDEMPMSGYSFYRLKATDFDGYSEYHGIASIRMENINESIKLFPNPTNGRQVSINFSGKTDTRFKLVSFTGNIIQTGTIRQGINEIQFTTELSPGIYFIQLEGSGAALPQKLVIR